MSLLFARFPGLRERLPFRSLGQFPTALTRVHGLCPPSVELWVKREDQAGVIYGGNKVRKLAPLLADSNAYFYVCGLKAMEEGVVATLRDIARGAGLDWDTVGAAMKREGRLHLETY